MRSLRGAVGVATFAAIMLGASLGISAGAPAGALSSDGEGYLANINALRGSLGLTPLQLDAELTGLSQSWAEHMASTEQLMHPPDIRVGVTSPWIKLGDNMALGSTFALTWDALINSPVHYRNLTDPDFTHVGIGVAYTADGTQYTHEWFMMIAPEVAAPVDPPAPPPVVTFPAPAPAVEVPPVVLGVVQFPEVNLAVIPPIRYGLPDTASTPDESSATSASSSWLPMVLALAAIALLLAIGASMALRSRRRRVG